MLKPIFDAVVRVLGSYRLAIVLFVGMFVATLLGTIAQIDRGLFQAQRIYFESWFYTWPAVPAFGFLALPLPGGLTLMSLLAVNLLVGGILRVRKTWSRAGILIMHLGVMMLLGAGLGRFLLAEDGAMMLWEPTETQKGSTRSEYESYTEFELVLSLVDGDTTSREWVVAEHDLQGARGGATTRIAFRDLPVRLTVHDYHRNARVLPKGPMFEAPTPVVDGYFVQPQAPELQAEADRPACYVSVEGAKGGNSHHIVWADARAPVTFRSGDSAYVLELRKKRMALPFAVELTKFVHERHPGTNQPRNYQSDIVVHSGGTATPMLIRMNEPLRREGYVAYQSSYGPEPAAPGERRYSVLAVSRNPADQWPLYSLLVMTAGMLLHFVAKLFRWIRRETAARQVGASA
jgi:hypothetical protein